MTAEPSAIGATRAGSFVIRLPAVVLRQLADATVAFILIDEDRMVDETCHLAGPDRLVV